MRDTVGSYDERDAVTYIWLAQGLLMGRHCFLVGIFCLQVLHNIRGFLVPEPFIVVHERVTVVGALSGDFLGNGRSGDGGLQRSFGHSNNLPPRSVVRLRLTRVPAEG